DHQAEKAAQRSLMLDSQYQKVEIEEKAAVEWLQKQIAATRNRATKRKTALLRRKDPVDKKLLAFANERRGSHRGYTLPSGITLEVWANSSVKVVGGDDKVAIAALRAAGLEEFIRQPPAPPPE